MTHREFIQLHGSEMTAKEIAEERGITEARVREYSYRIGVKLKSSKIGRPKGAKTTTNTGGDHSLCSQRPYKCFECPYDDCICKEARNKGENAFIFAGLQSDEYQAAAKRKARKNDKSKA